MIKKNIPFFIILALSVGHIYISAHSGPEEYNPYAQPGYQKSSYTPVYQPYNGPTPSAPPVEEPEPQPVKETHVYIKEKVVEKVTIIEKKEDKEDIDVVAGVESFLKICHLFHTIDKSGRAALGALLGTLVFGGVAVLCGNEVISKATGYAALGGTFAGGTTGLGYTLLYGTPKTQEPKVTVHVKTTYSY